MSYCPWLSNVFTAASGSIHAATSPVSHFDMSIIEGSSWDKLSAPFAWWAPRLSNRLVDKLTYVYIAHACDIIDGVLWAHLPRGKWVQDIHPFKSFSVDGDKTVILVIRNQVRSFWGRLLIDVFKSVSPITWSPSLFWVSVSAGCIVECVSLHSSSGKHCVCGSAGGLVLVPDLKSTIFSW